MTGIALVLAVAAMLTGRPGTQVADLTGCGPRVDGCADIAGNVIHLDPSLELLLERAATAQPYLVAQAVLVFGHEARHLHGTGYAPGSRRDEAACDRWAAAHLYRIARLLGASDRRARAMLRWVPWWQEGRMP